MDDNKYCQDCETEYYPQIEICPKCSKPLKTNREIEELKQKEKFIFEDTSSEIVAIREGDLKWLKEIDTHLKSIGFTCKIISCSDCNTGGCGETYQLIVPANEAQDAHVSIEEYNAKAHPELKESYEKSNKGLCPACGHNMGLDATECPDCGLIVAYDEET